MSGPAALGCGDWSGTAPPPIEDRLALTGILFVLKTGIPWEYLPQEMGCGCGMTCWRRLRNWHEMGVWHTLHCILLDRLNGADQTSGSAGASPSPSTGHGWWSAAPWSAPFLGGENRPESYGSA